MNKIVLAIAVMASACAGTWSDNGALELRYSGAVAAAGGALMVASPLMNGDGLNRTATAVGVPIALAGLAMMAVSVVVDPHTPPTLKACK